MATYDDTGPDVPHPNFGRKRVQVPKDRQGMTGDSPHRAYSDEAMRAAMELARHAEAMDGRFVAQRLAVTGTNLLVSGSVLSFGLQAKDLDTFQFLSLAVALVGLGFLFRYIVKTIGCAEVYYHKLGSAGRQIVMRHFGLRVMHWDADAAYTVAQGKRNSSYDAHVYKSYVWMNWFVPVCAAAFLLAWGLQSG
ncbi:hypothetical protein K3555_06245 [Leisingera sp. M527]|uniref:hypothetical protein n=1 Tax=Leisingera sp. M527 TaxID=2867014 RepID=UPI0021A35215|nr:hypothetical protein [Leisingera sp. M527]UWQ34097.1 hypothetical protein K3555_06245 [Leisingera sp. M527]